MKVKVFFPLFLFSSLVLTACNNTSDSSPVPPLSNDIPSVSAPDLPPVVSDPTPAEKGIPDIAAPAVFTGALLAGDLERSPLLDFNLADYQKALKTDKLIVLYFYADWCPLCAIETKEALEPVFNELTTDRVIGFRVNFKDGATDDDEEALAREFGIAYQHTKVFLKNGAQIIKSPATWAKDHYLEEINKNF